MVRIRYTLVNVGILESKQSFVAETELVKVRIETAPDAFLATINKVVNNNEVGTVIATFTSTNLLQVKKMIKEKLVEMGVLFDGEVRISKKSQEIVEAKKNTGFSYIEPPIEVAPF